MGATVGTPEGWLDGPEVGQVEGKLVGVLVGANVGYCEIKLSH